MIIYKNKNILSYRDISIIIFSLIVIFVYISVCTALTIIIINDDGGVKINEEHNLFGIEYLSCDAYKVNKTLSLNPSVAENFTQMKIRYTSDVKIHATSLKSIFRKEIDSVLNLNVPRLVSMRKAAKMQVVAYSKKKGKLTPSQKIYRIKANKTPEEGLLTSFYDISDYFFERLA